MTINEALQELQDKSQVYKSEVESLLLGQSPEELMEEMIKRDYLKNDCQKIYNKVKDQMADLEAICRKIREIKADQTHDNKKIDGRRWDLIATRKHSNA